MGRKKRRTRDRVVNSLFAFLLVFGLIPMAPAAALADDSPGGGESQAPIERPAVDFGLTADGSSAGMDLTTQDDTAPGAWDGSIDTSWYNTTDTEFTISTPAQLAGLAAITSPKSGTAEDDEAWDAGTHNSRADGFAQDNFAGKTVKLGADIDLGGVRWDPICDYNNWREGAGGGAGAEIRGTYDGVSWQGTLDGQGHVIKNLNIDGNVHASNNFGGYQGLISGIGPKGLVRNLGIDGGKVYGRVCGGVVGNGNLTEAEAESLVKADWPRIENCWTNLQVAGNGSGSRPSGGIFGGEERGATGMSVNVVNCYVKGLTTNGQSAGGIVGFTYGEVVGCYNVGTVGKIANVGSIVSCITVGDSSYADSIDKLYFNNMALVNSCTNVYRYKLASDPNNYVIDTTNFKTADQIKAGAASLGYAYVTAAEGQNDGYPVLFWQAGQTETSLAEATLSDIPDQVFTGSDIEPAVTVTLDGKTLKEGQDYVLSFADNRAAGTASVKAVGIGAFKGESAVKHFEIKKINLDEGSIDPIPTQWIYGEAATPALTVKDAFGNVLVQDTDYTVEWKDNTNTGTATVTVTGNGVSTYGSLSTTFKCILASRGLSGEGTEESPWLIGTKGDFQYFAHMVNTAADPATDPYSTGYFKLTADLDLTAADENDLHADPVARNARVNNKYVEQYFSGVFDGNGHSLTVALDATKLSQEVTTGRTQYLALFEQVGHPSNGKTAVIKNLTLKGSVKGNNAAPLYTSQIAGLVWGANGSVVLEGLVNEADISDASSCAVGIVGYCYNANNAVIKDCVNKGTITSKTTAAGICYFATNYTAGTSVVFDGCGNEGTITGGSSAAGLVSDIGSQYNTKGVHFEITRCYNTGSVTATSGIASGIFGRMQNGGTPENEYSITSCYNTGAITGTTYVGGIVANMQNGASMAIGSCYNTGAVTSTANNASTGVGGIVGTHGGSGYYYVLDMVDCYSTGAITAGANSPVGSIIGYIGLGANGTKGNVSLENSYYLEGSAAQGVGYVNDTNPSQAPIVVGAPVAKTADEMKATGAEGMAATLGASFADDAATPLNAGYPILWWQAGQEAVDASAAVVTAIPDQTFTGNTIIPQGMTATLDGVTLKQGADFTVTCTDNTNVGTATATLKFTGRYTGTATATFEIVPADINTCTFSTIPNQWTMADMPATPASRPMSPANKNLTADKDYIATYENNVETGTATMTWTGIGNWTGTHSAEFKVYQVPSTLEGSGTESDPYLIHDQFELQTMAILVNNQVGIYPYAFFALANDIEVAAIDEDAPATLTQISSFQGVFDGAGHSITRTDGMINKAPFNTLASGAVIRNLVTEGSITAAPQQTAAIAIQVSGTDVLIENCTNNMSIEAATGFCAGFVYQLPYNEAGNDVTFRNCVNNADIWSLRNGGVAGFVYRLQYSTARFENCANTGNIGSTSTPISQNAAFVGVSSGYATVRYSKIYVESCYNTGNIVGKSDEGTVVSCPGNTDVYITNYYNTGTVTVLNPTGNNIGAGGVVGFASSNSDTTLTLKNAYNAGTIEKVNAGTRAVTCGAIVGHALNFLSTSSVENTYFDASSCEVAFGTDAPFDTSGVASKTTAQMKATAFADELGDAFAPDLFGINDGYPVFGWQLPSLDEAYIAPIRTQEYTGDPVEPAITAVVVAGGKSVTLPATAYDVVFSDNVEPGTATVTLCGVAPWSGEASATFTISKGSIANATIAPIEDQTATGSPIEPELTVINPVGVQLVEGTDYTVRYASNTEIGKARAVVSGIGNYTGTQTATFNITAGSLADATISGIEESYDYTGEAIEITPVVTDANGKVLKENTDYTVALSMDGAPATEVKEIGSYEMTFTGAGNYSGYTVATFDVGTYFSVYRQEGANGEPELVKEFTKSEFAALAAPDAAQRPVSGMFWKNNAWTILSTDDYVTVDAILDAAGLSEEWNEAASIKVGDGGFFSTADYATIDAESNFYPNATNATPSTEGARAGMPAVIALTGARTTLEGDTTAGQAEEAGLEAPGTAEAKRFIRGITAEQLASTSAAGNRYASNCDRLILVVPEPVFFTVYLQDGEGGALTVAKQYTLSDIKALVPEGEQEPVSGMFFKQGAWHVTTAATYVTLDDVLADAGLGELWAEGATLAYGGDPAQNKQQQVFTYSEIKDMSKFYPKTAGDKADDSVVADAPFVLSLTEYSGTSTETFDCAALQEDNVAKANTNNTLRTVFGISAASYADRESWGDAYSRGMRYWSNTEAITVTVNLEPVDRAALEEAIEAAESALEAANVSEDGKDLAPGTEYVTPEAAESLAAAILAAGLVYADAAATQDEVDGAAIALALVQAAFELSKQEAPAADKEALGAAIEAAQADLDATPVSKDGSDVAPGAEYVTPDDADAFAAVVTAAALVYADEAASFDDAEAAAAAAALAQAAFDAAKRVAPTVEKSELVKAVAAATADLAFTAVSEDGGDLTPGTIYATPDAADALSAAIEAAAVVQADDSASRNAVDAAAAFVAATQVAFDASKRSVPTADKAALGRAIDEAAADLGATPVSKDGKDLAPGTKYVVQADADALSEAVAAAKAVEAKRPATQNDVDAAGAALALAQVVFDAAKQTVPDTDKEALDRAISMAEGATAGVTKASSAKGLDKGAKYATPAAFEALGAAIESASAVSKDAEASQNAADKAAEDAAAAAEAFGAAVKTAKGEWARLGGSRVATAAAIAREAFASSSTAIVVSSKSYADALGASALAGAYKCPIIVTAKGSLSKAAKTQLNRLKVKTVIVLGGKSAVSDNALNQIKKLSSVKTVKRVSGSNRYATSLAAYKQFKSKRKSGYDTVIVVAGSGSGYADALSISPYVYAKGVPVVVANTKTGLSSGIVKAIKADKNVKNVLVVSTGKVVDASKVKSQLGKGYDYTVISGADAYATNAKVVDFELAAGMGVANAAVASGKGYTGAIAAGPLAGGRNSVLVLAKDADSAGVAALASNKASIKRGFILGNAAAVSAATAKGIAAKTDMEVS